MAVAQEGVMYFSAEVKATAKKTTHRRVIELLNGFDKVHLRFFLLEG
jgi:hypothetical protein